jgi:hypothetical protein
VDPATRHEGLAVLMLSPAVARPAGFGDGALERVAQRHDERLALEHHRTTMPMRRAAALPCVAVLYLRIMFGRGDGNDAAASSRRCYMAGSR